MLIGYSDEKKGYRLLSDGKFIVIRDVIFDETESLSVEEVEKQLIHLEEKLNKEQIRMQHLNKTRNEQWFDFTSEVQDDEHVEDTLEQVEDNLNSSQVNLDDSNQVKIERSNQNGKLSYFKMLSLMKKEKQVQGVLIQVQKILLFQLLNQLLLMK